MLLNFQQTLFRTSLLSKQIHHFLLDHSLFWKKCLQRQSHVFSRKTEASKWFTIMLRFVLKYSSSQEPVPSLAAFCKNSKTTPLFEMWKVAQYTSKSVAQLHFQSPNSLSVLCTKENLKTSPLALTSTPFLSLPRALCKFKHVLHCCY